MEWPSRRENSRVRSRIFDRGRRFPVSIRQFPEKVTISLHTFENSAMGLQKSTPYRRSDMEWSFRRENSNIRSRILDSGAGIRIHGFLKKKYWFCVIHSSILWKSVDFAAYMWKICFWGLRNWDPYRRSEMEWPFGQEFEGQIADPR